MGKNAQDMIYALKKQLAKLQRMNNDSKQQNKTGGSALLNHQRQVMPTPLRGGGKKRNAPSQSQTAQFFNSNKMRTPTATSPLPGVYNNFYKSPNMAPMNMANNHHANTSSNDIHHIRNGSTRHHSRQESTRRQHSGSIHDNNTYNISHSYQQSKSRGRGNSRSYW